MKRKVLNLLIGSLLVSVATSHAEVIFEEAFPNSGGDAGLSLVGWHANLGSTGVAADENSSDWSLNPIISGGDYIFYNLSSTNSDPVLIWTDKEAVSVIGAINNVTNITLTLRNQSVSEDIKVALKVGGAWYVSQDVLNNAAANADSVVNLAVQSVSWNSLSLIPGTTLAEGGAVSLPSSGTVQAVGIFDASDTAGQRVRIINYTVEAIPEIPAFQERFDNPGADAGLQLVDWKANLGSAGTTINTNNADFTAGPIISSEDYLFYRLDVSFESDPILSWTEKAEFGEINAVSSIDVTLRNDNSAEDLKVALKVAGAWYVTQDVLNNDLNTVAKLQRVNVQTAAWNHLDFEADSTLAEGGAASLPSSGLVQAVGIFDASISVTNKGVRILDFTIFTNDVSSTAQYSEWTSTYLLSGSDAELDADPDSDAMNNLVEYALGGNPTNSDASAVLPVSGLVDAGSTNWLEYVYHRRLDAASRGLTYEVMRNDDLVLGVWTNSGITEAGTVVLDAEFEAVTNRIPTETDVQQFMKLNIGFE